MTTDTDRAADGRKFRAGLAEQIRDDDPWFDTETEAENWSLEQDAIWGYGTSPYAVWTASGEMIALIFDGVVWRSESGQRAGRREHHSLLRLARPVDRRLLGPQGASAERAHGAVRGGEAGVPAADAREIAELRAERDWLTTEVDLWMDATHKSWAVVARLREAMPDADVIDAGADVANEFATTGRANFERGLAVAGDLRQAAARIRALDTGAVRAACGEAV